MAKKSGKDRTKFLAKLVTENKKPCAFCQREIDDEITYGKLYAIGDIQCHYFCVLLSCCLVQKGRDQDGLFGFLYPDILAEIERSKKHRCSYCSRGGATLGCSISQCRKQFHLPCGRERNAVSLFYGNYKSFCKDHAPKQKVAENVMVKARVRMRAAKKQPAQAAAEAVPVPGDDSLNAETACVICYEEVDCFPTSQTFWPPCCARDAWFHRSCLQRMALSAGMHYLKCPLCNDKENFFQAVIAQGFYVPDRDAAWELEQNAFAEIYERELICGLQECVCPSGREFDAEAGPWDIKLCLLCGSLGAHAQCLLESGCSETRYVCATCKPAAPDNLDELATSIENVILCEQARASQSSRRPLMPSRMSLRRTKRRQALDKCGASISTSHSSESERAAPSNLSSSRQDLNLKTPKKPIRQESSTILQNIDNTLFSPLKMIEHGLREKVRKIGGENVVLEEKIVAEVRQKFRKPKPLSEKRKLVNDILDDLMNRIIKKENPKVKEPIRSWQSPKKEANEETNQQIEDEQTVTPKRKSTNNLILTFSPNKTPTRSKKSMHLEPVISPLQSDDIDEGQTNNQIDINSVLIVDNAIHCEKDDSIIDLTEKLEDDSAASNNFETKKEDACKEDVTVQNLNEDDSSNSTFQLPSEFIAEESDNSLPIFDTPKKLKTVENLKDSSMEISENNDIVNIDVVKIENVDNSDVLKNLNIKSPTKSEKCTLKISPKDKKLLVRSKMNIDLESFKNRYLNEVDKDLKCSFGHKHDDNDPSNAKLRTAIDFAIGAAMKTNDRKRKMKTKKKRAKKRKMTEIKLKYDVEHKKSKKNRQKSKRKGETEVSIQNDSMKVKISLKKEKFRLRIMQSKVKNKTMKNSPKMLKQYILKYPNGSSNEMMSKPEKDVTPIKKKYVKQEKTPDNLVQTSIQSFFKSVSYDSHHI